MSCRFEVRVSGTGPEIVRDRIGMPVPLQAIMEQEAVLVRRNMRCRAFHGCSVCPFVQRCCELVLYEVRRVLHAR